MRAMVAATLCVLLLSACADQDVPIEEEDSGDTPHRIQACPDDVPETAIGMMAAGAAGLTLRRRRRDEPV